MGADVVAPNRLQGERLTAGFTTQRELAERADIELKLYARMEAGHLLPTQAELFRLLEALGNIPVHRVYGAQFRQMLDVDRNLDQFADAGSVIKFVGKGGRLFVSKDEMTWIERQPSADTKADALLSMSCGFYSVPHLMLDSVAVCEALGVSYVAVGGAAACCGKPLIGKGKIPQAERWVESKVERMVTMGVTTRVSFCTACQSAATIRAARKSIVDGGTHPLRDVWFLDFFAERIRELGDKVPWKKEVRCRVLAEGHDRISPANTDAQFAVARLLELVPGVEVVGFYDGFSAESPCGDGARPADLPPFRAPETTEEVQHRRMQLADIAMERGADTIACQHQRCHEVWGRYASDRLAVRHAVSILADALGCAHPDRQQVASWLGDPEEIVEQTTPNWTSWGMSHDQALELAKVVADPRYAAGVSHCSCGGRGDCGENLISVDILRGQAIPT